jgi:hypothetical protein
VDEAATTHHGGGAPPYRGGYGDVMGQAECRQPKPTDSRIMAPKLRILYPGTRSGKSRSGRGEAEGDGVIRERCKGTEQPERLQCKIALISAAEEPHGRLKSAEGFLSQRFPPSCRGLRSFTSLCRHTHRRWGSIGNRGTTADRDRRGGAVVRDYTVLTTVSRVRLQYAL